VTRTVGGTATGAIGLSFTLPASLVGLVTVTESGGVIAVAFIGTLPTTGQPAITGSFPVTVSRGSAPNATLTVNVNIQPPVAQPPTIPVTGVSISPAGNFSLIVNGTRQLNAIVTPANATNNSVTWTSSNPAVATVSSAGLVRAVAAGTATITVTTVSGGRTASVVVTVTAPIVQPPDDGNGGGGGFECVDDCCNTPEYRSATITGGSVRGGTSQQVGSQVTIDAGTRAGYRFVRWDFNPSVTFALGSNRYGATTTFVMPNRNVGITSVWESIPQPSEPPTAGENHTNIQNQIRPGNEIAVVELPAGSNTADLYGRTLDALIQNNMSLRIATAGEIVWTEITPSVMTDLRNRAGANVGVNESRFSITTNVINADDTFVSTTISFAINGEIVEGFAENIRYAIVANLGGFDTADLNPRRITAIHNGRNIGGNFDPETGLFRLDTWAVGEFTIAYVASLQRFYVQFGSHQIIDLITDMPLHPAMDVLPVLHEGRTLLPVRFVAYALGAEVDWIDGTEHTPLTVILYLGGQTLSFGIGELLPGMDVPAILMNSRTMVPLRFISETFLAHVVWNGDTSSIEIIR
jgi:hypothetical protein